jgi:cytochrome c biogenesis protein CcmG, thiol:disulfide interchange protein DsbE
VSRALVGIALFGAIALATARSPAANGDTLQLGQSAPAFRIDTIDGSPVTNDFGGRPAYINVFTTWCTPCRGELPSIVALTKRFSNRIAFLFVDEQEPVSTVERFARQFGVAPIAVDPGPFAEMFAVDGLPWSIFIDRRGIVRSVYAGLIPADVLAAQLLSLSSS